MESFSFSGICLTFHKSEKNVACLVKSIDLQFTSKTNLSFYYSLKQESGCAVQELHAAFSLLYCCSSVRGLEKFTL